MVRTKLDDFLNNRSNHKLQVSIHSRVYGESVFKTSRFDMISKFLIVLSFLERHFEWVFIVYDIMVISPNIFTP